MERTQCLLSDLAGASPLVLELAMSVKEGDSSAHKKEARLLRMAAAGYAIASVGSFAEAIIRKDVRGLVCGGIGALASGGFIHEAGLESRRSEEEAATAITLQEHIQENTISSDVE
jgi:hypothetical protein